MNKIEDLTLINEIRTNILGLWPNRKNDYFPGPSPVSIERKNFQTITKYEYVISLKTDGTRYFLIGFNGKTYFVDRNFYIYEINIFFNEDIYGNSVDGLGFLFDGEYLDNNYLIHDCACIFSKDISQDNFNVRYDHIKFVKDYFDAEKSSIKIEPKQFYTFNSFTKEIYEANIDKIDGLILTPVKLEIGTHTQYTLFKWKETHTFDFKIRETEFEFEYYVLKKQILKKFSSVLKHNEQFLNSLKKNCPEYKNGDIVECILNKKLNFFEPIKIRYDKMHPNTLSVIQKTRDNVNENITLDELIDLFKSV